MCVIYTIADKPFLHQLKLLKAGWERLSVVEQVAANWKTLGLALHFEHSVLETIDRDVHFQSEDACQKLLSRWLDGKACHPITWERLLKALKDAKKHTLAEKLKQNLAQ